jgi:tetratricopeptide (TPR) repeat protein
MNCYDRSVNVDDPHLADQPPGFRFAQRELTVVILLSFASAGAFVLTRAAAQWDRRLNQATARTAFAQGERALAAGQPDAAAASFRAALVRDRDEHTYAMALADALAAAAHADQALELLDGERTRAPEDGPVNLRLARLAAAQGDLDGAARSYHHAIYGVWPDAGGASAHAARLELVQLLLAHGRQREAIAEQLAGAADLK